MIEHPEAKVTNQNSFIYLQEGKIDLYFRIFGTSGTRVSDVITSSLSYKS